MECLCTLTVNSRAEEYDKNWTPFSRKLVQSLHWPIKHPLKGASGHEENWKLKYHQYTIIGSSVISQQAMHHPWFPVIFCMLFRKKMHWSQWMSLRLFQLFFPLLRWIQTLTRCIKTSFRRWTRSNQRKQKVATQRQLEQRWKQQNLVRPGNP